MPLQATAEEEAEHNEIIESLEIEHGLEIENEQIVFMGKKSVTVMHIRKYAVRGGRPMYRILLTDFNPHEEKIMSCQSGGVSVRLTVVLLTKNAMPWRKDGSGRTTTVKNIAPVWY